MLCANEIKGFIQTASIHKLDLGKKKIFTLFFLNFFFLFCKFKETYFFFNLDVLQN